LIARLLRGVDRTEEPAENCIYDKTLAGAEDLEGEGTELLRPYGKHGVVPGPELSNTVQPPVPRSNHWQDYGT